ncbi:MAG: nitrate reductase molybdenum cofactor assembly chaperone [Thermoanaerobaculia bacterium]
MNNTFAGLAEMFRYPESPFDVAFVAVIDDARDELDAFARETSSLDRCELEAAYTSTFDLAPSCSPYVGEHLFGEEGRHRIRLMIGLRTSYENAGIRIDEGELPDHIAGVLKLAAHEEAEEWRDLIRLIVLPALTKMDDRLRASGNPYRHLVTAARQTSEAALRDGGE